MGQSRLGLALFLLGLSQFFIVSLLWLGVSGPESPVFTLLSFIGIILMWIGGGVRQNHIFFSDEFDRQDGFKFFVYIWLFWATLVFFFLIIDIVI